MARSKLIKFASFWPKTTEQAGEFLSGVVGQRVVLEKGDKVFIFRNTKPSKDNSPSNYGLIEDKSGGGGDQGGF